MSVSPQPIELRTLWREANANKPIYYMPLEQLNFWPERLNLPSRHFGVLLLCDGKLIPDSVVLTVAKAMTSQGLAYLCVWGPDCERIHDLFDEAIVEVECSEGSTKMDPVISHNDDLARRTHGGCGVVFLVFNPWRGKLRKHLPLMDRCTNRQG